MSKYQYWVAMRNMQNSKADITKMLVARRMIDIMVINMTVCEESIDHKTKRLLESITIALYMYIPVTGCSVMITMELETRISKVLKLSVLYRNELTISYCGE